MAISWPDECAPLLSCVRVLIGCLWLARVCSFCARERERKSFALDTHPQVGVERPFGRPLGGQQRPLAGAHKGLEAAHVCVLKVSHEGRLEKEVELGAFVRLRPESSYANALLAAFAVAQEARAKVAKFACSQLFLGEEEKMGRGQ